MDNICICKKNNKEIFYHLSEKPSLDLLTPKIPKYAVSLYEEKKTPRVCFSKSIKGCLSALQIENDELYVYTMVDSNTEIYTPSHFEVVDAFLTEEIWVLNEVKVKCLGKIHAQNLHTNEKIVDVINLNEELDTICLRNYDWYWIEKTNL